VWGYCGKGAFIQGGGIVLTDEEGALLGVQPQGEGKAVTSEWAKLEPLLIA